MAQQSTTEPREAPKVQGKHTNELQKRIVNKQENTKGTDAPLPGETLEHAVAREVKEEAGIEIAEISSRTKISKAHLVALEDETYDNLPAIVYVRGFVTELAKYLRLDPAQVQRTYLRRMREKPVS